MYVSGKQGSYKFCSLNNPQVLRIINSNVCMNERNGSVGFDLCWLTDFSESLEQSLVRGETKERNERARKLKVLLVPTGRYSNYNRIYGSSNSMIVVPTTVSIYIIPPFSTFSFDSCEGGGREEQTYVGLLLGSELNRQ